MRKLGFWIIALVVFVSCTTESKKATETTSTDATGLPASSEQVASTTNLPQAPEFQTKAEELPKTQVAFEKEVHDFGKVKSGEKVKFQYKFKNSGSQNLLITYVKPSCGCTTPNWSKDPVEPGKEGYIDVEFDSKGKEGIQQKTITVYGNFEDGIVKTLTLQGEVLAAK